MEATFAFTAELFEWDARDDASWVFVSLPVDVAEDIREMVPSKRGFGSVPVQVRCGTSAWRTSVFPSKESGSFVLPVKKAVRNKEGLEVGGTGDFEIDVTPE